MYGNNGRGVAPQVLSLDDCIAGDALAWQHLYERCHPALLRSIAAILGPGRRDRHLIDEIGARVWYALAANPRRLLEHFEPKRASFNTYLAVIARNELSVYLRSERRRRRRERVAHEIEPQTNTDQGALTEMFNEFVQTLTPKEKEFCNHHLLALAPAVTHKNPSSAGAWQLRHRVHRKLLKFLANGDTNGNGRRN